MQWRILLIDLAILHDMQILAMTVLCSLCISFEYIYVQIFQECFFSLSFSHTQRGVYLVFFYIFLYVFHNCISFFFFFFFLLLQPIETLCSQQRKYFYIHFISFSNSKFFFKMFSFQHISIQCIQTLLYYSRLISDSYSHFFFDSFHKTMKFTLIIFFSIY